MPAPICLAMVICDSCHRDPLTSKRTLIGTFSGLVGARFPLHHPQIAIYVALTDGRGKAPLRLEMIDVDEEREPVFHFDGPVTFNSPKDVVEISFTTPEVTIPDPGEYRLKLIVDGEFVMERWILVSQSQTSLAHEND
jgi:hypothetical protein